MKRHTVLALGLLLSFTPALMAQTAATGTIVGTVVDESNALVPKASIVVKDLATGIERTAEGNDAGQFTVTFVQPGSYSVTVSAPGFKQTVISPVRVEVAKSSRVDAMLQVGTVEQSLEVTAGAAAELQTQDATIGGVVDSTALVNLPTVTRRAAELLYLQVGAQPWLGWAGDGASGTVAGGRGDQNTFTLDGLDISDSQVGGTCCGNVGTGMPIPVESIEEFRAGIANQNASFGRSLGGQFSMTTRRGSSDYRGAVYWYHQNDNISANTWTRNRLGQEKPEMKDNRYGFRVGGPLLGTKARDRLFFFVNMEQRKFPQKTDVSGLMPSSSLRSGILRFRDNTGNVVSYDLATSMLCGPTNSSACDPRGIGLSPDVAAQFALLPAGNDTSSGDGLNTVGLRGPTDSSQRNDNVLARLDYVISQKWRASAVWAWGQNRFFTPNLNPGIDWRGGADGIQTTSNIGNDPYHINFALTTLISAHTVNEFRIGVNRSTIGFKMPDPVPFVPSAGIAMNIAQVEEPYQFQGSRRQEGISRTWQFVDNLNLIRGKHNFHAGVNYQFLYFFHSRAGASPLHLNPIAQIGAAQFHPVPSSQRPPTCSAAGQANCLQPGDVARWDQLYSATLGIVDSVGMFVPRDPDGRPLTDSDLINDGNWHHLELYFADTWRIKPTITLSLGVNSVIELPFVESQGRRAFLIETETGQPISVNDYLDRRAAAARLGKIYNPGLAFSPLKNHPGMREMPVHKSVAPRISVAWSPSFSGGWLGRLAGDRKTVVRGGFGMGYHRVMAVGVVQFPMIGNSALGQPSTINGPINGAGQPFRVGVDGAVPSPVIAPQIQLPFRPAVPFGDAVRLHWSPDYKFGYVHSLDLTIQREIPWNMVAEVGYIGRFGRRLEVSKNINAVPFFIADLSGLSPQTFAQAFDAVAVALRSGTAPAAVTPQPWFENSVGTGSTVALATSNTSDFINGFVQNLWLFAIDPMLPEPVNNRQILGTISHTHGGWNNYNAMFVSVNKKASHGLSFTLNYTFAKNLDTLGAIADSAGGMCMNPYDISYCYGPSMSDRRHGINYYGTWELPFGHGRRFAAGNVADKVIGGWQISNILTYFSGLPMFVTQGGQPFGSLIAQESAPAIRDPRANSGRHTNIAGSNGVGTAGDPATGGTGLNLFTDPEFVYNSFRHFLISEDTRSSRGLIRGLSRFTWDLSLSKRTMVTETIGITTSFDFFNVLNHPLFHNPQLNLLNPAGFGVITSQPGDPGNGDYWSPRRLQFGLRVEF